MFLETATTTGALLSAYILSLIFGAFLLYTAANSLRSMNKERVDTKSSGGASDDPDGISSIPNTSDGLMRRGAYYDKALKANVRYTPVRPFPGGLRQKYNVASASIENGCLGKIPKPRTGF
ncbi:MAG: hypothetical protein M1469_06125 [Bacteroidetes bacterium]|nr:hypothetical protein [Bacteroidota bacterium]